MRAHNLSRIYLSPWLLAAVVTLLAFSLYLLTMAPGLTWAHQGADGGDLATAVAVGGVPHPPGFPTYILLGKAFSILLPFGDVAFRLNVMSAVFGASTVGLVFLLTRTILVIAWGQKSRFEAIRLAASFIAAAALACGPLLWSQSVLTEVYTLNSALFALIMLLGLRWWMQLSLPHHLDRQHPKRILLLAAAFLGLGLGNHPTLAVLLIVGVPLLLSTRVLVLMDWICLLGAMATGLLIYGYLPIAAAGVPPVNWGHPSSLSGFWWTVSGTPYRGYFLGLPLAQIPTRLTEWSDLLYQHFNLLGVALGVLGLWHLAERARSLFLLICAPIIVLGGYSILYVSRDSFLYLIPAALNFSLLIGVGSAWLFSNAFYIWKFPYAKITVWLGILALGPVLTMILNFSNVDLSRNHEASLYIEDLVEKIPPQSMVLAASDAQAFSLWYGAYVVYPEHEIVPVISPMVLLSYEWYWETLDVNHPFTIPDTSDSTSGEDRLVKLVEHNLKSRSVYLLYEEEVLQQHFQITEENGIWRLEAREKET